MSSLKIFSSVVLLAAGFACLCLITKNLSQYFLLDNAIAALGILVTVLKMLSYIEFTYFGICNEIFAVLLYILMLKNNPEQSTYLIFSLYSLVCAVVAVAFAERNIKRQGGELSAAYLRK